MTLQVDDAAWLSFARIISGLRSARRDAGLSQAVLSSRLPVNEAAISEWEKARIAPTLPHLTQWSDELGFCLVIVASDGEVLLPEPAWPLPGETKGLSTYDGWLGR